MVFDKLFSKKNKTKKKGKKKSQKKKSPKRKRSQPFTPKTYTPEEKLRLLKELENFPFSVQTFSEWYGVTLQSLQRWKERYKNEGFDGLKNKTREKRSIIIKDAVREKIIELKLSDPKIGSKRISDTLKRHHFINVGYNTILKVLKDDQRTKDLVQDPPHSKNPPLFKPKRFERAHPRELYQMDIMTWMLKGLYRIYLIGCLDDNSRFMVSWGLFRRQTSQNAIDVLRDAMERYGHPKEVLTDNGRQFYAWRGKSEFQKFLIKMGIKHIRSRPYHPQTLGKIERFWKSMYQELLSREAISSFEEAEEKMKKWINHYNFKRTHQGIEGLTPADRFFGVEKPMREAMLEGAGMVKDALLLDTKMIKEPIYLVGRIGNKEIKVIAKEGTVSVEGLEEVKKENYNKEADIENLKEKSDVKEGDSQRDKSQDDNRSPLKEKEEKRDTEETGYNKTISQQMGEEGSTGNIGGNGTEEERKEAKELDRPEESQRRTIEYSGASSTDGERKQES